jgi:hypothetical protein
MPTARSTSVLAVGLVLLAGFHVVGLRAEGGRPPRATEPGLKAAFLTEFTRYTTWPTNSFSGPDAPILVAVLGRDPFGNLLDEMAAKKSGSRPIEVRRVATAAEAGECHVVFIARQEAENEEKWLSELARKPVLTVGESGRTIERGGIIEFVLVGGYVRFEASWSAMDRAGIRLRAPLLDLARKVHNPPAKGS